MKIKILLTAISAIAVMLSLNCSHPTQTTGNGSGTGNAVVGILYQPDGITPAKGVRVNIRPKASLADTSGAGLGKRLATLAATDSVVTDSAGRYAFDTTLDTGTYVITSASGNNAVLIDSVAVKNKAVTDTLAPDTLKPAGALKGVIKLSEGGDPRKVFVLAFGIDRFSKVDSLGRFKFSGLAEAKYDLRLISSLDNYGVLDTNAVPVRSADTTNLDTISLPFTGIPTPKNVSLSYDTLKQIVTLVWSKADTALVKSYNVYRRNVDSNTVAVRINASPVADTVYRDSTGVQGQMYEYRVAAVGKSAAEGGQSPADSAKVAGAYELVDSIGKGILDQTVDLIVRADGRIFVSDDTTGLITFSNNGLYQAALKCSSFSQVNLKRVFKMYGDNKGNLYVTGVKDQIYGGKGVILKLSPKDSLMLAFGYSGGADSTLGTPMHIAVFDTLVFVENTDDRKIKVFSANTGSYLYSIGGAGSAPGQFVEIKGLDISGQKELIVAEESRIQLLGFDGSFISSFKISFGVPSDLKLDNDGHLLVISMSNDQLYGFDKSGLVVTRFQFRDKEPASLYIDSFNNLYVRNAGLSFFDKYQRK